MERLERRVLMDAPISAIYGFVNEPYNLLRIFPGAIEISNVTRHVDGGRNFQCVFRMAGVRIHYTAECVTHIPNQELVFRLSGGLHGTMRWHLEAKNERTLVTFILEYEVPRPLLKHRAESEIVRQNEQDVQQLLFNLKMMIDRQTPVSE